MMLSEKKKKSQSQKDVDCMIPFILAKRYYYQFGEQISGCQGLREEEMEGNIKYSMRDPCNGAFLYDDCGHSRTNLYMG